MISRSKLACALLVFSFVVPATLAEDPMTDEQKTLYALGMALASRGPACDPTGEELAQTLRMVVKEVRPERLWLLANSMGGEVVVRAFSLLYQDEEFADPETEIDQAISGIAQDEGVVDVRIPAGSGIAGAVSRAGQTLRVDDAYQHPAFNSALDERTGFRTRGVLCAPVLNSRGEVFAVAQLLNRVDGKASLGEIHLSLSVADPT